MTGLLPLLLGVTSGAVVLLATQSPAIAAEGSLVCTPGTSGSGSPLARCTVSDPDGIRTVHVGNTDTGQPQAAFSFGCANPLTSFNFSLPAGTRYKVVVTDCNVPRVKTAYVIRPNGTAVRPPSPTTTSTSTSSTSTSFPTTSFPTTSTTVPTSSTSSSSSTILTTTTTSTIPPTTTTIPPTTTTSSSTTTSTSSTTTTTAPPLPVVTPDIFLGYADTLHGTSPGTQFVPDPWEGDSGVVFLGCTAPSFECGGSYDGGAIRIDNPLTNPDLTLTAASVQIGPCDFHPWDDLLSETAGPGGTFVLTQTGLLGPPQASPCDGRVPVADRPYTNFDTSEGPFDTIDPPFSNCDPDLVPSPVITLTFSNGMTLTIIDTAEILNTGGVDRFACSGLEEATPWVPVLAADITRVD